MSTNVVTGLPPLINQTQAATNSTGPVLQAVINGQPRSGSNPSQESQTTVFESKKFIPTE